MVKIERRKRHFLPRSALDELVQLLSRQGYTIIGPTVVDNVVSMREITSADQLPRGIKDEQDGGKYHLRAGDDALTFEFVVGPDGVKRYLFPPSLRLMQFHVHDDRFELDAGPPQVPKLAFLGIRPCEIAALEVQDRVFGHGNPAGYRCESDPWYQQARENSVYIAVNCTRPGGTCFCNSWGTGPQAEKGFDLALTELREGFVVDLGSERGRELAEELPLRDPTGAELELAEIKLTRAREHMGRELDSGGTRRMLNKNIENPHWDDVAQRCLSCGNCTMVCPTCFCSTVVDTTDLADGKITRTRHWESCFTHQFSYTVGGPGRDSIRGRYRHWLRHKLCTWWDQFEINGCVGCGRCITWCPVGIDLTKEVKRIRDSHQLTPGVARNNQTHVSQDPGL